MTKSVYALSPAAAFRWIETYHVTIEYREWLPDGSRATRPCCICAPDYNPWYGKTLGQAIASFRRAHRNHPIGKKEAT